MYSPFPYLNFSIISLITKLDIAIVTKITVIFKRNPTVKRNLHQLYLMSLRIYTPTVLGMYLMKILFSSCRM